MKAPLLTPPRVEVDADLAWLLRSAFAEDERSAQPANPERALQLARRLEISGRVAKRFQTGRGSQELGELGCELRADYYANVAKETLLTQAAERVEQLAVRRGVPIIALKFAGLRRANVVAAGARPSADLDVLVPKAQAREFWLALLDSGFERTHTHEYPHQLEALVDSYDAVVDLHVHIPGVTLERGGFATADQLLTRELVHAGPGSMLVPTPAILAAHAIAHALLQNRSTPQAYSPLRMVSDIMDLRCVQPEVVSQAARYLATELGATCESLELLCESLSRGVFAGQAFEGTQQQTLLWHCIAARFDLHYSERLRAAGLLNKLSDGSTATEVIRYVADLLYPATTAMDALYGPAVGRLGHLRRRLFRPVDLAVRAARRWTRSR